ncbi:hypothetical protein [Aquamicrobium sp. LC103]|uniref:hypothetical protein n=1 Tax=Aquamicrobium sp. LC103 TaxID=1120658 RepID=UPI00063EA687|nr:hypothetical protein [Aquamicrobium sp. LC103]TKT69824.1 hypothetical protein XW59_025415 [Aquamicrobium sp. LC103]
MRLTKFVTIVGMTLTLSGTAAFAEGFEIHDLTTLEKAVAAKFDKEAYHWATPTNMSISCCGMDEDEIVSVTLDRQTDEIGKANRTDEAYIAELEDVCTKQGICKIEEIEAGTAIARQVTLRNLGGGQSGVNIFAVKGGDRLTIQSSAKTTEIARDNAVKVLEALKGSLIGL